LNYLYPLKSEKTFSAHIKEAYPPPPSRAACKTQAEGCYANFAPVAAINKKANEFSLRPGDCKIVITAARAALTNQKVCVFLSSFSHAACFKGDESRENQTPL